MGLKYSSGESAALAAAMGNNLNVVKEAAAGLDAGVARLTGALSGGELQGAAYTAGKDLFEGAVAPAVTKASQAVDDLHADLGVYRQADSLVAHYGVLDEDSLNDQIRQYQQMRDLTRTLMAVMEAEPGLNTVMALTGEFRKMEGVINASSDRIRQLQERLKALQDFSDSTASLFTDSAKALSVIAKGLSSLNGAQFNADGSLAKNMDLGWLDDLNGLKFGSKLNKTKTPTVGHAAQINGGWSFLKSLFGTVQWEGVTKQKQDNGLSYVETEEKLKKNGGSMFNADFENGTFEGVSINLGMIKGSWDFSGGNFSESLSVNAFDYSIGAAGNVGVGGIGGSASVGKDGNTNAIGYKTDADWDNGLISLYNKSTVSKESGDGEAETSVESGNRYFNGDAVKDVGIVAGAVAVTVGVVAGCIALIPADVTGLGEAGQAGGIALLGSVWAGAAASLG